MIVGGVDTLEYSIDIRDYETAIESYIEVFEAFKLASQDEAQRVAMDGITMEATRTGIRNYAYGFKCEDFWIFFAKSVTRRNYPIWVKVLSASLWSLGLHKITDRINEMLVRLGFVPITTKVSRVDLTVDTDELTIRPEDRSHFVTHADKIATHEEHGELTGFSIGGGDPIMLRIYDKTAELKKSGKDWMKWLWAANEWYGDRVWRVEFQCRRDLMREMRIETLQDLDKETKALWGYLSRNWFRVGGGQRRVWARLEHGFGLISRVGVREKVVQKDLRLLMDMGKGILRSIGAAQGVTESAEVAENLAAYAEQRMREKGKTFADEVRKKALAFVGRQGE